MRESYIRLLLYLTYLFNIWLAISLWLVPPPDTREALTRVMQPSRSQSTPPNSYPRFDPHITLGSATTYEQARSGIPRPTQRFPTPVRFHEIIAGPAITGVVFISIHRDDAIMSLEAEVRKGLGNVGEPFRYPHMSFVYLQDTQSGERALKFVEEYTQKGIFSVPVKGWEGEVVIDCGEGDVLKGYMGSEIWIVECVGPVESWKVLEKVPLGG
jgi:2',3'-cyclic-nucleotide 3'-phosphodiesterase